MSMNGEEARELVERFAGESPGAFELAVLVSLAVRTEQELLRAIRLRLARHLSAADEAGVWFCPLVASRGEDGITFHREVQRNLRERLINDSRCEGAWKITYGCHESISPALRLEEEAAWISLTDTGNAGRKLDELFRPALVSFFMHKQAGVASWAARALPGLPEAASQSVATWLLAHAANRSRPNSVRLSGSPPLDYFDYDLEPLPDLPQGRSLVAGRSGATLELVGAIN